MKTKEELEQLKEEVEALNEKLVELSDEELSQVTAGFSLPFIGRHNIRSPLTTKLGLDLDGYNYDVKGSSIEIEPPDREYEVDRRALTVNMKR